MSRNRKVLGGELKLSHRSHRRHVLAQVPYTQSPTLNFAVLASCPDSFPIGNGSRNSSRRNISHISDRGIDKANLHDPDCRFAMYSHRQDGIISDRRLRGNVIDMPSGPYALPVISLEHFETRRAVIAEQLMEAATTTGELWPSRSRASCIDASCIEAGKCPVWLQAFSMSTFTAFLKS